MEYLKNFFHEILEHAYHDELMALRNDGIGLEKGQTREQFIGFEKDAREIERGRALTPKENEDVEMIAETEIIPLQSIMLSNCSYLENLMNSIINFYSYMIFPQDSSSLARPSALLFIKFSSVLV